MLATMRKGVGTIFAKVILGFIILSFVVWGVEDMLRARGNAVDVATVGSSTISALGFERDLREQEAVFKQRLGAQYNPEILTMMRIPQQLLGRRINEELFALEVQHLGLIPSDEKIAEDIRSNPNFRGLTGFEKEKFTAFLTQAGISENAYVASLKRDMGIKLLLATYGIKPTPHSFAVQLADAMLQETRELSVYTIPASAVPPLTTPTTEQLTETYQRHAKVFVKQETREASVALIEKNTEESATEAANTFQDLLAGGASFREASQEVGAVVSTLPAITQAGNLPEGGKAVLPKLDRLVEIIFATDQGGESSMVAGSHGKMYLVHVDKVTPESVPPLAQVRPAIEALWRQEQSEQSYAQLADAVAKRFQKSDARAKAIAEYTLTASGSTITRSSTNVPAELIVEAFSLAKNAPTGAYKNAQGAYVIAVVKSIPPASVPTFNAGSPNVTRLKAEMEQEQMEQFSNYLREKYEVKVHENVLARILGQPQ